MRPIGLRTGLLAMAAVGGLAGAPAALAASDYTWSGQNAITASDSLNWSQPGNWAGNQVPSSPADTLAFPALSSACPNGVDDACYFSNDDLGAVTVGQLQVDDTVPYVIEPDSSADTITLDPTSGYGLSAVPDVPAPTTAQTSVVGVPLILGDAQSWSVDGGSANGAAANNGIEVDQVSGNYALTLDLANGAIVYNTALGTGALTASGDGNFVTEELDDGNGSFTDAQLPTAGVTLNGGASLYVESADTTSGPLTINASQDPQPSLYLGETETSSGALPATDGTLAVSGDVKLDASADLFFDVDQDGTTPSTDFGQLTATGDVSLGGARLFLQQGQDDASGDCTTLTPGDSFPIISTTGALSGDLTYLDTSRHADTLSPGQTSQLVPVQGDGCPASTATPIAELTYGTNQITATIEGYAPTPASPQSPTIVGTPAVGDVLTVTDNGGWGGDPAPSYTYQWLACASRCTPIPGATGSTFTPTTAQEGDRIQVEVTATNSAGSAAAYSNQLGPVPTPAAQGSTTSQTSGSSSTGQTTTGSSSTSPTTGNGIKSQTAGLSKSQISSALSKLLKPTGKLARIPRIIADDGYVFSFDPPGAGRAEVTWSTTIGRHKLTVATGAVTADASGTLKLHLTLTRAGRKVLKASSHLRITVTTSFTPTGQPEVTSVTSLRLT